MKTRIWIALVGTLLTCVAATTAATAAEDDSPTAKAKPVTMRMAVTAERFRLDGNRAYAVGPAALRTEGQGATYRSNERIDLELRKKGGNKGGKQKCTVLDLHLETLFVALLGLEVTTSEVNLQIRGDDRKALGRLFCQLSRGLKIGNKRLARKAVHSLNQRIEKHPLRLVRINAVLHPQSYEGARRAPGDGGPRCQILDLDIGPLRLDLLGLVVDLYGETRFKPVHVDADADPNGGAVGASLCEFSGGPSPQA